MQFLLNDTKRVRRLLFRLCVCALTVGMLLSLAACGSGEGNTPPTSAYTFVDDVGTEIRISTRPGRVAVLFSSFADIWVCAGGEVAITVGEAVERGFADASAILVDEGAGKTVNLEALIAAAPELVICSADIEKQVQAARVLNQNGIPAACFTVESFDQYLRVLKIFTDLTEQPTAYKTHGTEVQARIDAMLEQLEGREPTHGQILFVRAGSSASSTKAKNPSQHFAAAMLEQIGTYNIAQAAPVLLDGLSIEEILRADPDYIFISTMGDADAAKQNVDALFQSEAWSTLRAVQNKNYVYLPKDLFQFKPNARWDEAYEYLIGLVYGDEAS
jgi:iron complex transport system substrate-binding protein